MNIGTISKGHMFVFSIICIKKVVKENTQL